MLRKIEVNEGSILYCQDIFIDGTYLKILWAVHLFDRFAKIEINFFKGECIEWRQK